MLHHCFFLNLLCCKFIVYVSINYPDGQTDGTVRLFSLPVWVMQFIHSSLHHHLSWLCTNRVTHISSQVTIQEHACTDVLGRILWCCKMFIGCLTLCSCLTCLTSENNAVCYSCIRSCHEGHNTEFVRHDRYVFLSMATNVILNDQHAQSGLWVGLLGFVICFHIIWPTAVTESCVCLQKFAFSSWVELVLTAFN